METPQLKAARDRAAIAFTAVKELRDRYNDGKMSADVRVQFNKAMADFNEARTEFETAKTEAEVFSSIDTYAEQFTKSNAPLANGSRVELATSSQVKHVEAFGRYMQGGDALLTNEEKARYILRQDRDKYALSGNVDSLGGFTVPDLWFDELVKDLAGFSVMRRICKVKQTSSNHGNFLTLASGTDPYPSGLTGAFRSEGWISGGAVPATQDQPRFGRERVPVHTWSPDVIEFTRELLADSGLNLEVELRRLLAETKALDEESAFILGTGIGMPMGIMTEVTLGNIATVSTVTNDALSYTGLVNLYMSLPAQYRGNSTFLMNSLTLGAVMLVEDTEGHLVYNPNTVTSTLFGRPVEVSEYMPNVANATNPILVGDFQFYGIVDRQRDMQILRLVEKYAPNVGIMAIARVGGQLLKTSAFRAQVVA